MPKHDVEFVVVTGFRELDTFTFIVDVEDDVEELFKCFTEQYGDNIC